MIYIHVAISYFLADTINFDVQFSETQTSAPFKIVHHNGQPPLEVTMATIIVLQGLVVMVRTVNVDIQKKSEFVIWEKEVVTSTGK